jgi:large subunit ribosomal protein L29
MKKNELVALSNDELSAKEKALKEELFKLNMQRYGGRVEKPHLFSSIKKDIARIKTIQNLNKNTKPQVEKKKIADASSEKRE